MCECTYIYIYIYMSREREVHTARFQFGANVVATNRQQGCKCHSMFGGIRIPLRARTGAPGVELFNRPSSFVRVVLFIIPIRSTDALRTPFRLPEQYFKQEWPISLLTWWVSEGWTQAQS